ncbi:MAG: hypothetical protein MHPSP_003631, partial [Paramarteilia canceri]
DQNVKRGYRCSTPKVNSEISIESNTKNDYTNDSLGWAMSENLEISKTSGLNISNEDILLPRSIKRSGSIILADNK